MKRFLLLAVLISLCQITVFGQKKYEMVVEKTDGTEVVFNVEDIVRTYFRERSTTNPDEPGGEVVGDENVYTTCPDDNHPHAIDLGLPSGTKWACCNVGANTPEAYGNYYAWGEILPKNAYTETTYQHYQDKTWIDIGSDIAGTIYDTATANWGELWRMPTKEQCEELKDNCSIVWTTVNGVNGRVFTGVNGQAVFLPAAGVRQGISLKGNDQGLYRSSTSSGRESAWILYFAQLLLSGGGEAIDATMIGAVREWGYPVRPVR